MGQRKIRRTSRLRSLSKVPSMGFYWSRFVCRFNELLSSHVTCDKENASMRFARKAGKKVRTRKIRGKTKRFEGKTKKTGKKKKKNKRKTKEKKEKKKKKKTSKVQSPTSNSQQVHSPKVKKINESKKVQRPNILHVQNSKSKSTK